LSEVDKLAESGGDVATINGTLDVFSVQARKGVSRLVASYQQDGDESSITAITTFITNARQALGELAPKLPPESLKSAVEALATVEQLAQHTTVACPKCDAPKPAKGGDTQPNRPGVSTEPSDPGNGSTTKPSTAPTPGASVGGQPTTAPTKLPNTTIVEESNTPPPSLKTPPSSQPTTTPTGVPTVPTPGTTSWPWPFPTLSLPTPIINVPGVIQTLLPPWK
jgi:hypothetical protein